jgi:hypothetical protein
VIEIQIDGMTTHATDLNILSSEFRPGSKEFCYILEHQKKLKHANLSWINDGLSYITQILTVITWYS